MADMLQSMLMPEYPADAQMIDQRQQLANALMQQSLTPQQGQMISGHYIHPAFGGIDRLASAVLSQKMMQKNLQDRTDLNRRYGLALASAINGPAPAASAPSSQQNPSGGLVDSAVNTGLGITPQTQPAQPTPQDNTPQFQNQPSGAFNLPNLMRANAISEIGGPASATAYWKQYEPTEATRMALAAGQDPRAANAAMLQKEGALTIPDSGTVVLPNGKIVYGANLKDGVFYGTDAATGAPIAMPIPNAAGIAANRAGAIAGATKAAELPYLAPTSVNTPSGPRLMTQAQQIAGANKTGGLPLQSPEEQKVQDAKAESTIAAAKMQAAADPLLKIIQQAREINDKVPSGGFGLAELKAGVSTLPGFSHENAKNAALWEQMTGQSVLNTITNLAAAGGIRMDIPIVQEIQKAGGIPLSLPAPARAAMLDQLESEVKNRLASSQNTTPNLNRANLAETNMRPMVDSSNRSGVIDFGSLK